MTSHIHTRHLALRWLPALPLKPVDETSGGCASWVTAGAQAGQFAVSAQHLTSCHKGGSAETSLS